ncbi:metal-sulfur cluster assembly factor [Halarcobacter bivalviorum]|uniref:FeS assembly SUF system protein n=1 Tax=Halarcobacter bivalviorum TaxID=663364 RepID=A0AAX2A7S2_9BACT|nr:iron-sulfur cluster assembly protein [Halarcobacter bivalviorum]AXH12822.1 [Fe-S] cluster assembly protein [Halarcobacter bivalviorum]RXK04434.1 FeS assembly SUF system protein [Halarcobacter bivalviorum]RXK09053.1 FeS assembly SUF system protein [Halarcobacter bivalviorum]
MSLIEDKEALKEDVIKRLKSVYDPEIPVNIYDLGLIYKIDFEEKNNYVFATIEMTLTSPACPVAESLVEQVKYVTQTADIIDEAYVHLVFDPPWDPSMISEEGKEVMAVSGAHI